MAHYFIFPEKDTTIYSHPTHQSTNTGIDEILTLRDEQSFTDNNYYPSRILIQFKNISKAAANILKITTCKQYFTQTLIYSNHTKNIP